LHMSTFFNNNNNNNCINHFQSNKSVNESVYVWINVWIKVKQWVCVCKCFWIVLVKAKKMFLCWEWVHFSSKHCRIWMLSSHNRILNTLLSFDSKTFQIIYKLKSSSSSSSNIQTIFNQILF
jgi:hypothetical protein